MTVQDQVHRMVLILLLAVLDTEAVRLILLVLRLILVLIQTQVIFILLKHVQQLLQYMVRDQLK